MKKFLLAAIAAFTLSLGVGSAYAQNLVPSGNQPQVTHSGPAYASDVSGN